MICHKVGVYYDADRPNRRAKKAFNRTDILDIKALHIVKNLFTAKGGNHANVLITSS